EAAGGDRRRRSRGGGGGGGGGGGRRGRGWRRGRGRGRRTAGARGQHRTEGGDLGPVGAQAPDDLHPHPVRGVEAPRPPVGRHPLGRVLVALRLVARRRDGHQLRI